MASNTLVGTENERHTQTDRPGKDTPLTKYVSDHLLRHFNYRQQISRKWLCRDKRGEDIITVLPSSNPVSTSY